MSSNNFRIVQTQSLMQALPYEVEERRQLWFMPWPVWRRLKDFSLMSRFGLAPAMRFQTPREARLHIENLQDIRAQQLAEQRDLAEDRRLRRQLPRVIEVVEAPVLA